MSLDDAFLFCRDAQTFGDFYARHAKTVFACAMAILRNRHEAEDVVQEVFFQAWKQQRAYDAARGTVTAWLIAIARSRSIDRLRAARTSSAREADACSEATGAADFCTAFLDVERTESLHRAVSELPFEERRLLELAYDEGLSHSVIAAVTKQPLGTVKTRIRRALAALRRQPGALAGAKPEPSERADTTTPFTIRDEQHLRTLPIAQASVDRHLRQRLLGLQVLVVDNDVETLRLTSAVLKRFGAVPQAHSSSRAALRDIEYSWPHVMIVDLDMPDEDGYSFFGKARTLANDRGRDMPPTAAFTAFAGELERSRVRIAGFNSYLTKPVHPLALLSQVSELAAGKNGPA